MYLAHPYVTEDMRRAVNDVLNSRYIGQGPLVEEFESEFQELLGTNTAVAVGSGTDALHLAYILAGVGPSDEVITPVFTCTATNFPILWQGAKIVFADIDPNTLCIDTEDVKRKITDKTKVIVGVDYAGVPCDWDELNSHGITTIDDASHAPGAVYKNTSIGACADFTTFSFQAIKHITTGDGGMLTIKDKSLVAKAKRLRWFGLDRENKLKNMKHWEGDITEVGYKYQMTDIAAAMGLKSLERLFYQIVYRNDLVKQYREGLKDVVTLLDGEGSSWLMTILAEDREALMEHLEDIETSPLHYRNDNYTVFKEFKNSCPNIDKLEDKILCLPLHMELTSLDVNEVIKAIRKFYA